MAELDNIYEVCLSLTKQVGVVIKEAMNKPKDICEKSSHADLVTETDKEVEEILIHGLLKTFPHHKVIAEETQSKNELTDDPTWIIDPIDGTLNFVHTFPFVTVSIALYIKKIPEIGIIYNPILDLLYTARKGQGAFLNGKPIKCTTQTDITKSLMCMGLYRDPVKMAFYEETYWSNLNKVTGKAQGIRVTGSAAQSMAFIASGAADGYFEYGLQPWDIAAGELLVKEAGGTIVNFKGEPFDVMKKQVICAGTEELAQTIAKTVNYDKILFKY